MYKVAIDVGHGLGNTEPGVFDPGAVGSGYKEHVIVAGMAARLRDDLVTMGFQVLLTSGQLTTRDDTAKKWGANLLVSLHCNSHTSLATGTEAWIDTSASSLGKKVAWEIVNRLSKSIGIANRGVKVKNFAVLRANPNDVLIEMFFINNESDTKKYQADVNSHELAILNGILVGVGLNPVGTLPRLNTKNVGAETKYSKVIIHTDNADIQHYVNAADAKDDFIKIEDTTKDSWKTW